MKIEKIAVLGGGQMGAGIAEAAASKGIAVALIKATPGPSDNAKKSIAGSLGRLVEKQKMSQGDADAVLGRITFTDDMKAAADADLFVESIVEDLEIKRKRFAEAD